MKFPLVGGVTLCVITKLVKAEVSAIKSVSDVNARVDLIDHETKKMELLSWIKSMDLFLVWAWHGDTQNSLI